MKSKTIVIALGGNALGFTFQEQRAAVAHTAEVIADLVTEGFRVVITHGNGPQVGMIHTALNEVSTGDPAPMPICVGMSQGSIGYDLQNAIRSRLMAKHISKQVTSVVTQVVVNPGDEAFTKPTKPIGRFMTEEEAQAEERRGNPCMEDSGRGYRSVVPSPKPLEIVEMDTIRTLVDAGNVVIACGGGGIPVTAGADGLQGVRAVIDKDFASALLAKELAADYLVILTAVEKVAINFGKDNQEWLAEIDIDEAHEFIRQGQFAPGSMLPKVEAAIEFAQSGPQCRSLITLLERAKDGILGKTGTVIHS